jgi:DNA-directed RNA polymerase subunit K/omega
MQYTEIAILEIAKGKIKVKEVWEKIFYSLLKK